MDNGFCAAVTPIANQAAQSGLFVLFYELSHPTRGQGAQQQTYHCNCFVDLGLVSLPVHQCPQFQLKDDND